MGSELSNYIGLLLDRKDFSVLHTENTIEVVSTVKIVEGEVVVLIEVFDTDGCAVETFIDDMFRGTDCVTKYLQNIADNNK